jgi:hypothetical protein
MLGFSAVYSAFADRFFDAVIMGLLSTKGAQVAPPSSSPLLSAPKG